MTLFDKLKVSEEYQLGLVDRFYFGTGLLEPVSFSNRFIQTGFYLGNRFKVNEKKISIKDLKLRLNLKYSWENWFQNFFFNKTGSKTEPIPINRFKNGISSINRFKNGTGSDKPV